MGEGVVRLRFETECSRIELKRSRECVVDSGDSELESPSKKLAVEESCSSVVDSVEVEILVAKPAIKFLDEGNEKVVDDAKCRSGCVVDIVVEVESRRGEYVLETTKVQVLDEERSEMKLRCDNENECVLDTSEAEIPQKQLEMESLDDANSLLAASECGNECVRGTVEAEIQEVETDAEIPQRQLEMESLDSRNSLMEATKWMNESVRETVEADIQDRKLQTDVKQSEMKSRCENEYVLDTSEAEILQKRLEMESLDDANTLLSASECGNEFACGTVEAEIQDREVETDVEIPRRQLEMESLDSENSLMEATKCMNESVRGTVEAEIQDRELQTDVEVPQKEPEMESNSLIEATKCMNESVCETMEVEIQDRELQTDAEVPQKEPEMESNSLMEATKCMNESVRETLEADIQDRELQTDAEVPQKEPEMESLDSENSLMEATKCMNESVRETLEADIQDRELQTDVEAPQKEPEMESLDSENSLMEATKCMNESVRETLEADIQDRELQTDVEVPQKEPEKESNSLMEATKCMRESVRETVEAEIQDKGLQTDAEVPQKELEMESLDSENSLMEATKCVNESVRETVEVEFQDRELQNDAEISQKHVERESLDNENSLMEATMCMNESLRDTVEAEVQDTELEIESLNDENSPKAESKCSKECVLDEILYQKTEVEPLNDAILSDPKSKCMNECAFGIDAVTCDTKSAIEALVVENSSSNGRNLCKEDLICLNECAFDASEAVAHNSRTPKEFANEEKNSRGKLKRSHEWIVGATEEENLNKKPALRSSNYEISSKAESKPLDGCLIDASSAESPNHKPVNEVTNAENFKTELKCVEAAGAECLSHKPSQSIDNKSFTTLESHLNEGVDIFIDATEAITPNNRLTKESLDNNSASRVKPHECGADLESDCLDNKPIIEISIVGKSSRVEPNCSNECVLDAIEIETPNNKPAKESSDIGISQRCLCECDIDATEGRTHEKNLAKEFSTESVSEVLNPNVSPHENASSSQTVSSQPVEGLLRSGCRDITSSSADVADKEGPFMTNFPNSVSKSEVVLGESKVASTRGIRRIVFTFSKSKNCSDAVLPSTSRPSLMDSADGFSYSSRHWEPHMNYSKVKTCKNVVLENYTKNVKKLLSTGVLDGVEVKYINEKKEIIQGIIKDCGYLCGCVVCNFSQVLNAHEFEQHAGCKTKHPNDHVYLENGKSLYSIVQELKKSPASSLEETLRVLVGPFFNEKSYLEWKESLEIDNFQTKEEEWKMQSHLNLVGFPLSTMSVGFHGNTIESFSCSSEDTEDNLGSVSGSVMQKFPVKHKTSMLKSISKGGKKVTKSFRSTSPSNTVGRTKKRDNDLHRLLFMPNGLPDGAELAYYARGQRVLDGYKQGNGIVCSCCESEISPSQFEAHAGCAAKRQPYRHIFTSNGVSLHDIALSLAKGQCLAISNSSEKCTICGDGGDVVLCDACSHGFHAACLELQCIPEEGWFCPYCNDKIGSGRKVASTEPVVSVKPITIRLTRIVKPPVAEVGGCVVCRIPDFSVLKFDERTVILCDQCEKEYHVGCLRKRGLCDLKELPQGKWFCCDPCNRIHATLQNLISAKAKVIPPSMSNRINRKLIEKGLTCEVGNDVQWKVLSGKFGSLEHRSLLSSAVTLFRDSFDPIVERSGRDLIPAMVYGRNVSGQEFGGMYCAVLSVKSVVVSAGLIRIFGLEVAELPLVATAKESQGKGYFQVLFACIEKLLRFLNVEKLVLPAAEDAKSIWTNKFGFKKMTDDQFLKYTRDIQLISFKGTLMLEKTVLSPA